MQPLVVPISVGILIGLFLIQTHGTARVGAIFGPIILVYFAVLAVLGVDATSLRHPEIIWHPQSRIGRSTSSGSIPGSPSSLWARWCWR